MSCWPAGPPWRLPWTRAGALHDDEGCCVVRSRNVHASSVENDRPWRKTDKLLIGWGPKWKRMMWRLDGFKNLMFFAVFFGWVSIVKIRLFMWFVCFLYIHVWILCNVVCIFVYYVCSCISMYIDLYYVYLSFLKHPSWCRISSIYSTFFGGVIFGILFTKPILESLSMMYWSIFCLESA